MTDLFAALDEPRRPWLDPDALKEKFHALSSQVHPDRVHTSSSRDQQQAQDRYTALNAAYQCLRDPRTRLRHLLELERGSPPGEIQQIPPDLMNLFVEVGQILRQADSFLADRNRISSPILKVQSLEHGDVLTQKLQSIQAGIVVRRTAVLDQLETADSRWSQHPDQRADLLPALENCYFLLGYFDRWLEQLQERIVQISF